LISTFFLHLWCTEPERRRRRRDDDCRTPKNTCELLLVADETFYKTIGMGSVSNTVLILVS